MLSATAFLALLLFPFVSWCASLQQITDFGDNPTGTKFYIYVPDQLQSSPSVIVALHYCGGTAEAYYNNTEYKDYAEQYNFIVIYPESPYDGPCWDVSSQAALSHGAASDSKAIADMVKYTISTYGANKSSVFVTGTSSGAMMTNVMCATYPDVFRAGSVYSGVAAGCFYTGTVAGWNTTCATGQSIHSPIVWGDTARAMYPGYTGAYPRMLIWHGTADETLLPPNFWETLKQWTNVWGYNYTQTPVDVRTNDPQAGYTRYVYGKGVEGVLAEGVGHTVPVNVTEDLIWFGLKPLASEC